MSALVWWVIPIVITAIAIAVVGLRSRMGEPRDADPMAERARLRAAMERPIPRSQVPPDSIPPGSLPPAPSGPTSR
jgi:hypothetical protein